MHDPSGRRPESPWEQKIERAVSALEEFSRKFDRAVSALDKQVTARNINDWACALASPFFFVVGVVVLMRHHRDLWDFPVSLGFLAFGGFGIHRTLKKIGWIDWEWLRDNKGR